MPKVFKKALLAFCMILAGSLTGFSQDLNVKGKVVDSSGLPLIGAGVIQVGTTNGVITDMDGNFSITVPEGSTLEFSYVSYITQQLPASAEMNVVLQEDTQMLDETVVIGYGIQKKSDLTGAISSVKGEDFSSRSITSPELALQGKTAGVQLFSSSAAPGASPTVRIRGISSNGSSDPLYVVDGQITDNISNIDPNDIESMEVLKDGASAAIYGARAGNGVILVTTKKGNGKGHISYDMQLTSQSLGKIPQVMNAAEYIQYYLEDGRFTQEYIDQNYDGVTDTDWIGSAFENSISQRHSIKFDASSDNASIYASLSYLNNNGMFVGDSDTFKRITAMLNTSWKITPWLEIYSNNQFNNTRIEELSGGGESNNTFLATLQLDPLTPVKYSADDLPQFMQDILNDPTKAPMLGDGQGNYWGISAVNQCENINPFILRDSRHTDISSISLSGTSGLNLTPIKGLTITGRLSYRFRTSQTYGYTKAYYANSYMHQDYMTLNGGIQAPSYFQVEAFANYMKSFGEHDFTAMIGTSYSQNKEFYVSGEYSGSTGDLGVIQNNPLYYFFRFATATASRTLDGAEAIYTRNNSYYGRLSYSFKNRYMLQVSLRADAADSSILPSNNKWGYFPAVSLGWTISDEPFMDGIKDVLPYWKLRMSWGQNGSTATLGDYLYASVIGTSGIYPIGNSTNYLTAYKPTSTGNNDLKWETSEQFNVGTDLRLLDDRFTFTMDWFLKKTKDLLISSYTPSTVVGVTASPINAGDVENRGFEFEIGWQDSVGDFHYGINANAATLHNEVTYLYEALSNGISGVSYRFSPITRFEKGYPAWHYYGYQFTGIDPTNGEAMFADVNNDGEVTEADKTDIGSGIPKITYGLTFTAAWKNFDFAIFGSGAAGHQIFCALNRVDYAVNKLTVFTNDRWTPEHTNATNPKAGASSQTDWMQSSASVFDGSYFKIKQIQLGYSIPKNILEKVMLSNARVYVSLEDFFTFTKYPGFDPEIAGTGNALGVDFGSYPTAKKVVFGLNITF